MAEAAENQSAWGQRAPMQEPYFVAGQYMLAIRKIGDNRNGDPFVNMQVTQSHDNKRVNMYVGVNFNLSVGSTKAQRYNTRKFAQFREAIGAKDGVDPQTLIDKEICMNVNQSGFFGDFGYSFREPENYQGITRIGGNNQRPHDERNPPPMAEPHFDVDDDDVPF